MSPNIIRLTRAGVLLTMLALAIVPARAHEEYRYVGTIEKLDTKTGLLTVTWVEAGRKQSGSATVTVATSVTRNGVGVAKSELKVGLSVVVLAEENIYRRDLRVEATDVMIVPPLKR